MVLDIFFSILFIVVFIYLCVRMFYDTTEMEWNFHRWVTRTFGLCSHGKAGYEYMVRGYYDSERTIICVRCFECHKEMRWFVVKDSNVDFINITSDFVWRPLSKENFVKLKVTAISPDKTTIRRIKRMQKNITK